MSLGTTKKAAIVRTSKSDTIDTKSIVVSNSIEDKYSDNKIDELIAKIQSQSVPQTKLLYKLPPAPRGWRKMFKEAQAYLDSTEREINKLMQEINTEHKGKNKAETYPEEKNVFRAFALTPLKKVRVVILFQDPYPGTVKVKGKNVPEATGVASSGRPGQKIPKSLYNMFLEIKSCYPDFVIPKDGDIEFWAKQGIFLLNKCLTLQKGVSDSHKKIWNGFIKEVIRAVSTENPRCIYVLWGRKAQEIEKEKYIVSNKHYILTSGHPSPQSYHKHFKGNQHFLIINKILEDELNQEPIYWCKEKYTEHLAELARLKEEEDQNQKDLETEAEEERLRLEAEEEEDRILLQEQKEKERKIVENRKARRTTERTK